MRKYTKDELAALLDLNKLYRAFSGGKTFLPQKKGEEECEMKTIIKVVKITLTVLAVLGVVCAIAYGIYRFINRDFDDEFDDEFDDFDDDFYDDVEDFEEFED